MAKFRQQKIDEEIKRELCSILPMLKDPRFDGVLMSVVSVIVTKDLKYAKVYISAFTDDDKKKEVLKGLNSSSGFIRKEISSRTKLRYTPELNFVIDDSIEYGSHINQIINKLNGEQ
ncbi:MAG: 30S ribosome-binding factor RbfA [Clostridia bacterium]|nr:30S ribosome-binding factor RbfA [Clostridia bacterium]